MKFFYFPITEKISKINYNNTIKKRITFDERKIFQFTNNNFGVWGFKNGKSNTPTYESIEKGDVIFFRTTYDKKYQCFDGFGVVYKKENNPQLAKNFWNDEDYQNLVYFGKVVIFDKPFRLAKDSKKLESLTFGKLWHNGYNMFRQWYLKKDDEDIKSPKDLINYFYSFKHKVLYDNFSVYNSDRDNDLSVFEDIKNLFEDDENISLKKTEKEIIIKARVGQSKLRDELISLRNKCELCSIDKKELLIASHIKPWSKSLRNERLDINNVLLLCPLHDQLFDKGFISFDEEGKILISNELKGIDLKDLNIIAEMKIKLPEESKKYFKYHRENIFRNHNNK